MNALRRLTTLLLMLAIGCCWTGIAALAQQPPAGYVTPAQAVVPPENLDVSERMGIIVAIENSISVKSGKRITRFAAP